MAVFKLKISHIDCRYQTSVSVLIFKLVLMFNHNLQLERALPKHDICFETNIYSTCRLSVAYRGGEVGVFNPPPRNSEGPQKSCQTQPDCENLKIAEFRTPTLKDVRKEGSKILKLPSVRNCFTLAMANKLVVIINSLKVPKIKKIVLYEMKFLVPNYSCLQNP